MPNFQYFEVYFVERRNPVLDIFFRDTTDDLKDALVVMYNSAALQTAEGLILWVIPPVAVPTPS